VPLPERRSRPKHRLRDDLVSIALGLMLGTAIAAVLALAIYFLYWER
jgi:hypothetical protein